MTLMLLTAMAACGPGARPDGTKAEKPVVGHVTGQFTRFEGSFVYEKADPGVWKASATIDAASIDRNDRIETDGVLVGDGVDITLEIEGILQKAKEAGTK